MSPIVLLEPDNSTDSCARLPSGDHELLSARLAGYLRGPIAVRHHVLIGRMLGAEVFRASLAVDYRRAMYRKSGRRPRIRANNHNRLYAPRTSLGTEWSPYTSHIHTPWSSRAEPDLKKGRMFKLGGVEGATIKHAGGILANSTSLYQTQHTSLPGYSRHIWQAVNWICCHANNMD